LSAIVISFGIPWAQAQTFPQGHLQPGTLVSCKDPQGNQLNLQVGNGHPTRLHPYDFARAWFQDPQNFAWIKLQEYKNYGLGSVYILKSMAGSEIHLVETVRHSRLCGRGSCDGFKAPRVLNAKLITSLGQTSHYACTKNQ
ncbi:MAG: hypothetical protein ACK5V3_16770, partial [Bdellovibrionales bacterium]